MKFDDLVSLVLEANLYNKDYLLVYINDLLKFKNVQKQQIKDWFLKQYVAWYISSKDDAAKNEAGEIGPHTWREGQPEWAKKPGIMYFYGFSSDTRDFLSHVIDYFNQLDENELNKIYKQPYEVVQREVAEWDEYLASQTYKGPALKEGKDVRTVMTFSNGFKWQRLLSQEAYNVEGQMMSHCVAGYFGSEEKSRIYSLKDPKGESHVTIEYVNKAIYQIRGKGNEAPIKKYWPYVKDFILKFNLQVANDGENVGMVKIYNPMYDVNYPYYYFEGSPQYLKQLKMIKEYTDMIVKEIFETAKSTNNVVYNIDLSNLGLTELPDFSNLTVLGYCDISNNNLTSLKGSPRRVQKFDCRNNKLTSLEGSPDLVELNFNADKNYITSLKGAPMFQNNILDDNNFMYLSLMDNKIEHIDIKEIYDIYKGFYSPASQLGIYLSDNPISLNKDKFDDLYEKTLALTKNKIVLHSIMI